MDEATDENSPGHLSRTVNDSTSMVSSDGGSPTIGAKRVNGGAPSVDNVKKKTSSFFLDRSVAEKSINQWLFSLHPTGTFERVSVFLLCFIALPSTQTAEACFTPSPDVSYVDIHCTPVLEFVDGRFTLLRFRSKYWIGVMSKAPVKAHRCREVLEWIRQRKTTPLDKKHNALFSTSISSPALTTMDATTPRIEATTHHETLDLLRRGSNVFSRYRECHALLCEGSEEVIAIAPCERIHSLRLKSSPPSSECQDEASCPSSSRDSFCSLVEALQYRYQVDIQEALRSWLYVLNPNFVSYFGPDPNLNPGEINQSVVL